MPKEILNILNASNDLDFIQKLCIWVLAILVPLYDVVGALILLIIIDLFTGVVASLKARADFDIFKILNTVTKVIIYSLILFACWLVESKFIPEIPFLRLGGGFLALVELRSIAYNFKQIFGVDLWQYIRAVINRKGLSEIPDKKNEK